MSNKATFFKQLGTYLRKKRASVGLSQAKVASTLGYSSAQFISNFERGLCAPPLPKLKKLIDLYKLSPLELTELLVREQRKFLAQYFFESPKKHSRARNKRPTSQTALRPAKTVSAR